MSTAMDGAVDSLSDETGPTAVPGGPFAAGGHDDVGSSGLRLALALLRTQTQELNRLATAAARAAARPADLLAPDSGAFAEMAQRSVPRWHFAMLNDTERNTALATALERVLPRGSTVLDIGTGTGLLAMSAIRAGAARVYTCEENPLLAEMARQIIAGHGMSDVVTVLDKRSDELRVGEDLDARVDVVVSEIVDCGLIGEGLLPSVRHARAHLLAPGGLMVPVAARVFGQLISSPVVTGLNRVTTAGGFDVSLMNAVATRGHFPVRLTTWPFSALSDPLELVAFDFAADPLTPGSRRLAVPVIADGEVHALVAWFEMSLGAGITLHNAPYHAGSHWMQALVPFEKPAVVTAGGRLGIELRWTDTRLSVR